jgi:hypothetical protein
MDGSEIIMAWLEELSATQPEYGPLLQSTIESVGGLPAASSDGAIYTVSHDRYWYAAGYAKAFASQMADSRRITAVLAEMEAKKARDEPEMVRNEAEADFWGSVQGWVDSAGASRMRPEAVPPWLAKLDPQWNPDHQG